MGTLKIGGLDPSLNNFGMIKGLVTLDDAQFHAASGQLTEAPPTKDKKAIRKNSDDLFRARKHQAAMTEFFRDVDIICVEIPVGSQSARAMASYGICIGIISSIGKPLIQVTPAEVKMVSVGSKTASKKEMIEWAAAKHPNLNWYSRKNGDLLNKNEHLADAVAAIHAGMLTDEFKGMLAIRKNQDQ